MGGSKRDRSRNSSKRPPKRPKAKNPGNPAALERFLARKCEPNWDCKKHIKIVYSTASAKIPTQKSITLSSMFDGNALSESEEETESDDNQREQVHVPGRPGSTNVRPWGPSILGSQIQSTQGSQIQSTQESRQANANSASQIASNHTQGPSPNVGPWGPSILGSQIQSTQGSQIQSTRESRQANANSASKVASYHTQGPKPGNTNVFPVVSSNETSAVTVLEDEVGTVIEKEGDIAILNRSKKCSKDFQKRNGSYGWLDKDSELQNYKRILVSLGNLLADLSLQHPYASFVCLYTNGKDDVVDIKSANLTELMLDPASEKFKGAVYKASRVQRKLELSKRDIDYRSRFIDTEDPSMTNLEDAIQNFIADIKRKPKKCFHTALKNLAVKESKVEGSPVLVVDDKTDLYATYVFGNENIKTKTIWDSFVLVSDQTFLDLNPITYIKLMRFLDLRAKLLNEPNLPELTTTNLPLWQPATDPDDNDSSDPITSLLSQATVANVTEHTPETTVPSSVEAIDLNYVDRAVTAALEEVEGVLEEDRQETRPVQSIKKNGITITKRVRKQIKGLSSGSETESNTEDSVESDAALERRTARKKVKPLSVPSPAPVVQEEEGEGVFEVEKILAHRKNRGRIELFVKWKGFNHKHNTWEPYSTLMEDCKPIVLEFMRRVK